MSDTKEFWTDGYQGVAQGGWLYRDVGLNDFIKRVEADPRGKKVVGIKFDGKNVELITEAFELDQVDVKLLGDKSGDNDG